MNQVKAMLFRRYKSVIRSFSATMVAFFTAIFASLLSLIILVLMKLYIEDLSIPITFNSIHPYSRSIGLLSNPSDKWTSDYYDIMMKTYLSDTGYSAKSVNFNNISEFNNYTYDVLNKREYKNTIIMGFHLWNRNPYKGTIFYNDSFQKDIFKTVSYGTYQIAGEVLLTRMIWKLEFGMNSDFRISQTNLNRRTIELLFGIIAPMILTGGLMSILMLIMIQPISDIHGESRNYMVNSTLKLFPYWFSEFIIDMLIWTLLSFIVWTVLLICGIVAFVDNSLVTIYIFVMTGPSFLLMSYCLTFVFQSKESAPRQLFTFLIIIMVFPFVAQIVYNDKEPPMIIEWLFSLIPHINCLRLLSATMINIGVFKHPLSYYWKYDHTFPYLLMQIVLFFAFMLIMFIIEHNRKQLQSISTNRQYRKHRGLFERLRFKNRIIQEFDDKDSEMVISIKNLSRIFFDSTGTPIPALNNVSIDIKKGCTYGFLGGNGAGKSTMFKILTSTIPPSFGIALVNGHQVGVLVQQNRLSLCPQFNDHLFPEMTPNEHFYFYYLLYELSLEDYISKKNYLINTLSMEEYVDKPVRELSGGQQRKLAVALSFFDPSQIVLLDEPTSSLDPFSRHSVHELINLFKGVKTIILCTHLLTEAESLCDYVSIMVKGQIYTMGSPQYLSTAFRKEFRIDILLDDTSEETEMKLNSFISLNVPNAEMILSKPKNRLYTVKSTEHCLSDRFEIFQRGKLEGNGYSYYTCTTLTLESVFLETIKNSEEIIPHEETSDSEMLNKL